MKNTLITKIIKFEAYLKLSELLLGVSYWLLAVSTIWLSMFLLDNLLALPSGLRLPLTIAGTITMLLLFFKRIFMPAKKTSSIERTALELEKKLKIPDNILINSCQFSQKNLSGETKKIVGLMIKNSEAMISGKKYFEKKDIGRLIKWIGAVTITLTLWLLYITFFPHHVANAFNRYILPLKDNPPMSSVLLTVMPGSDLEIFEGDDLTVSCSFDIPSMRAVYHSSDIKDKGENAIKPHISDFNPSIVFKKGKEQIPPVQDVDGAIKLKQIPGNISSFAHLFLNVKNDFSFRIFGGGTYSRSIRVSVIPRPKIVKSQFTIISPDYIGEKPQNYPGPPGPLNCLAESKVKINIELDNPVNTLSWQTCSVKKPFKGEGKLWSLDSLVSVSGQYQTEMFERKSNRKIRLCEGVISIIKDNAPEIDFTTDDRNRIVNPGAELALPLQARDDYGIKNISVNCRMVEERNKNSKNLKSWDYIGPPGKNGAVKETFKMLLDPSIFAPGNTYLFQASCQDFSPAGQLGISKPLIIRIKSVGEVEITENADISAAVKVLKETIQEQKKANAISDNVNININDILRKKIITTHADAIKKQQENAFQVGKRAISEFNKCPYGKSYVSRMTSLIEGEMALVLNDIKDLCQPEKSKQNIGDVIKRQEYILTELIMLLGKIADRNGKNADAIKDKIPSVNSESDGKVAENMAKSIKNDLENYAKEQKNILDASKQLRDKSPEDLTDEEENILGELAREQSKWAKLFEEKLTDWSKVPGQDFSDGAIAQEFNEIFQEVKLAEKSLYEKKIEIAVPHEQAGIESAEELIHNLEKWFPDTPDFQKWSMEDPKTPLDLPLAELPSELEDIVGDLMDKEEDMAEDVEDLTSAWMDSLDKGAGWDAADGPISNMSAKGVTGNRLPNQNEVGGRSGEGRTGRSSGQMVEATAQGKDGRQTPSRLSPSPFEAGSIEDSSKEATGGATGGGKLSGFTDEGLRGGPTPETKQQMARLAGTQSKIRQQAEQIALRLSAHNLPSGDLESAIIQMKDFENAIKEGKAQVVRKSYNRILDYLKQADNAIKTENILHSEKIKLPKEARDDIMKSLRQGMPKEYEAMISEYFKALADEK